MALCVFIFSLVALVNETTLEWIGLKPYATNISGPVMALALFASGHILNGFRTKTGFLWLGVLACAAASVPLSVWRSDSLRQFLLYSIKVWPLFFFICAALLTVAACEKLLYAQIIAGGVMTVLVASLGKMENDRLTFGTGTFSNSNELALRLLLAGCCLIYLIDRGGLFRLLGFFGLALDAFLIFRTGSRGAFLGIIVVIAVLFVTLRRTSVKAKMLAMLAVLSLVGVLAAISNPVTFHRLTDITLSDQPAGADVIYAQSSEMARKDLLAKSIELSISHPLVGVGMGEFVVAVDNAAKAEGKRSTWSGTHNSYTQLSSECGFAAAFFYIAILIISLRSMYRLYRSASLNPSEQVISGLALTLFAALVCLTVDITFFHMAYDYFVPVFSGMAVALDAAVKGQREKAA